MTTSIYPRKGRSMADGKELRVGFQFDTASLAVDLGLSEPLFAGKNPLEGTHYSSTEQTPWANTSVTRELAKPLFELLDDNSGIATVCMKNRYTLFMVYSSAFSTQKLRDTILGALRKAGYDAKEFSEPDNDSAEDGQAQDGEAMGLSADELAALLKRKDVAEFVGRVAVTAFACPFQGMTIEAVNQRLQESVGVQDASAGVRDASTRSSLAQDLGGLRRPQRSTMAFQDPSERDLDDPVSDDLDGPSEVTDAGGWTTH